MQISILVPTYCRPHQLREALASVASQDRTLIGEVLIGDDSPPDVRRANEAEIAASNLGPLVRYFPHDPPKGNYPNQWALADQARFDRLLILHDDDHLCEGALTTLAQACEAETDERVKVWFGRDLIMDEAGVIDPERSASNARLYGKDGPPSVKPMWQWALSLATPPDGALIDRKSYVDLMRGERDGNVGDWGFVVRVANKGAWARFVGTDISHYRVQNQSVTSAGRGADSHYTYELAQKLRVPDEGVEGKKYRLQLLAEVATVRYLRDGERANAWRCYLSSNWRMKRRFSPRGIATLGMLMTPPALWRWALKFKS